MAPDRVAADADAASQNHREAGGWYSRSQTKNSLLLLDARDSGTLGALLDACDSCVPMRPWRRVPRRRGLLALLALPRRRGLLSLLALLAALPVALLVALLVTLLLSSALPVGG